MSQSSPFSDPLLPFPIKVVPSPSGPVRIYDIPDDQKQAVLEKLYILRPVPSLDDLMEDIHAEKRFRVREFLVAREGEMNVLASPYYLEAGGTVIDWWPVRRARKKRSA
jgi:hypothetical protein